jgi:FlaA1/EpsC-like NDP-sugar epimerase
MSIDTHNVAIVGLGRVGSIFLRKMSDDAEACLRIKCVVEIGDTPGKKLALEKGIPVVSLDGVVEMGTDIDVIFNFTGDPNVTTALTRKLEESCNHHTKVSQDRVARLIWSLIEPEDSLPEVNATKYQAYADMVLERQKKGK